jgi:hypothetical protein
MPLIPGIQEEEAGLLSSESPGKNHETLLKKQTKTKKS